MSEKFRLVRWEDGGVHGDWATMWPAFAQAYDELVSPRPPAQQVDFRPVNDRANMARMSRDAMDVRCLGTVGGLVGVIVAFFTVGLIGQAADNGAVLLLLIIAVPIGWWVGARTALGLLAR